LSGRVPLSRPHPILPRKQGRIGRGIDLSIKGRGEGRRGNAFDSTILSALERLNAHSRPYQNFTCGGVCAPSVAANSAIGLLERNTVEAHNKPGNVLREVLYVRAASM
jgi:hypothetical protein